MSDPSAVGNDLLEIPGPTTAWKTYDIPPIHVQLPVHARAIKSWLFDVMFLLGAMFFSVAIVPLIEVFLFSRTEYLIYIFAVMLSISISLYPFRVSAVLAADSAREGPALILSVDSWRDSRQFSEAVSWDQVAAIKIRHLGGLYGTKGFSLARLKLRTPITAQRNFFRPGGLTSWRSRGQEVDVLISELNEDSWVIGQVMAVLVKRHGGQVEGHAQYGLATSPVST